MNNKNEVELRVCKHCDAPLPYYPKNLSYYNLNAFTCDDCYLIKK